jgi:hypothetical protein
MAKMIYEVKMECTVDGHSKQWTGELYDNNTVITKWGPIGGNEQSKEFKKSGQPFLVKKMMEKERKGYVVISNESYEN